MGFDLVPPDAADDLDTPKQGRVLGQLDDCPRGTFPVVGDGIYERVDIAGEEGPDTHRAGLLGGEDRGIREAHATEPAGCLAEGPDHGMGGGVIGRLDPIVGPGDHRLVHDRDRRDGSLASFGGELRFRQSLAHEQLVVHGSMLTDALVATCGPGSRGTLVGT